MRTGSPFGARSAAGADGVTPCSTTFQTLCSMSQVMADNSPAKLSRDDQKAKTRVDLLDAGMALLLEEPTNLAFSHLKAGAVAQRAGKTTGAFYFNWPSQEDYLDDLLAYIVHPDRDTVYDEISAPVVAAIEQGVPTRDWILAGARKAKEVIPEDAQTILEMLLVGRAARASEDDKFRKVIAESYRRQDEVGRDFYKYFMERTGREPRPPFTDDHIAPLLSSVSQGLAFRFRITPTVLPEETLGWVLVNLIPLFTRKKGDPRDVEEALPDLDEELPPPPEPARRRKR